MADPHVRRYLGYGTNPARWRSGCCSNDQWGPTYDTQQAAVVALADHLENEHRMTVQRVTVLDFQLISTVTGGYEEIGWYVAAVPLRATAAAGARHGRRQTSRETR